MNLVLIDVTLLITEFIVCFISSTLAVMVCVQSILNLWKLFKLVSIWFHWFQKQICSHQKKLKSLRKKFSKKLQKIKFEFIRYLMLSSATLIRLDPNIQVPPCSMVHGPRSWTSLNPILSVARSWGRWRWRIQATNSTVEKYDSFCSCWFNPADWSQRQKSSRTIVSLGRCWSWKSRTLWFYRITNYADVSRLTFCDLLWPLLTFNLWPHQA